jgi:hypothetical protein
LVALPSWLGFARTIPRLAQLIEGAGTFLAAIMATSFTYDVILKDRERASTMAFAKEALQGMRVDCHSCLGFAAKCRPETAECLRLRNVLQIDDVVKADGLRPLSNYGTFLEKMRDCLEKSTESVHVMPLTRESFRNFYDAKGGGPGDEWCLAQSEWSKKGGRNGHIQRVVLIDENEINDPEFAYQALQLVAYYREFSEIVVGDIQTVRRELKEPSFVARDFGIFYMADGTSEAVFTYISPLSGQCFVKSAGNEYFATSPAIIKMLRDYFNAMWSNREIRRHGEILVRSLGNDPRADKASTR